MFRVFFYDIATFYDHKLVANACGVRPLYIYDFMYMCNIFWWNIIFLCVLLYINVCTFWMPEHIKNVWISYVRRRLRRAFKNIHLHLVRVQERKIANKSTFVMVKFMTHITRAASCLVMYSFETLSKKYMIKCTFAFIHTSKVKYLYPKERRTHLYYRFEKHARAII